ncbi:MAG: signal peptidase I [Candidatus Helarchaeota archaeon]
MENNEKKKDINIKSIIWTIIWIVAIIGGVFLFFFILQIGMNTNTPLTVVSGRSMEPTYYEGDLLIVQGVPYENIIPGDHYARNGTVVVYKRSYDNLLIVHRVTNVRFNHSGNGIYEFETWGDNNPVSDGWQSQDNILGAVVFRIPWLGWISLIFTEYPLVGFSIVGLIIIVLIITSFESDKEKTNKNDPENNTDYIRNKLKVGDLIAI